jgi:hypothetical protein
MKHEGFCEAPSCARARLAAKMARLNAASGMDVLAADALLTENETLRAALTECSDALTEAGKDFALASPLAVRPNLYELHAQAARAALAATKG